MPCLQYLLHNTLKLVHGLIPGSRLFDSPRREQILNEGRILLFFFLILFLKLINFNWRIITLQYCDGFCHTSTWIGHRYTCVPPSWTLSLPTLSPWGFLRAPALGALLHALNLHWSSILHMVIYVFQCYSLKSSHPGHLPLSPKFCSLYLCFLCCSASRIVVSSF